MISNPIFPHCPHCDIELSKIDSVDWAHEDDICWVDYIGECPTCKRQYRWTQIYSMSGYENLKRGLWYED